MATWNFYEEYADRSNGVCFPLSRWICRFEGDKETALGELYSIIETYLAKHPDVQKGSGYAISRITDGYSVDIEARGVERKLGPLANRIKAPFIKHDFLMKEHVYMTPGLERRSGE